jgi:hypothetical protein
MGEMPAMCELLHTRTPGIGPFLAAAEQHGPPPCQLRYVRPSPPASAIADLLDLRLRDSRSPRFHNDQTFWPAPAPASCETATVGACEAVRTNRAPRFHHDPRQLASEDGLF